MKKEVLIVIKDTQGSDDGSEIEEIVTRGHIIYGKTDTYMICYDESLDGGGTCRTTIKVKNGDSVSVVRKGAYVSELIIERGKRQSCFYSTPYGDLMIGIFGSMVESNVKDGSGELKLAYTIDYYGDYAAENKMTIIVTADGGKDEAN